MLAHTSMQGAFASFALPQQVSSWHWIVQEVLNILSLPKDGKGFLPWPWNSYNSLGLDTLGTRRKMSKWQEKWDRKGAWHLVAGLMTAGRSLVDSLHFLELTASADPEYRGWLGVRLLYHMQMEDSSLEKKSVLPHVFLWTAIKLGYRRMYSLEDLDQQ